MRVIYTGKSDPCALINGKEYECLGEENGYFRVIDEEGKDDVSDVQGYLYEKSFFDIVN